MKQLLRSPSGATRGYYIINGDRKEIFTPEGKRLGMYLESRDATYSASGALVGFGDLTTTLLEK
jgi:hypothetical protein